MNTDPVSMARAGAEALIKVLEERDRLAVRVAELEASLPAANGPLHDVRKMVLNGIADNYPDDATQRALDCVKNEAFLGGLPSALVPVIAAAIRAAVEAERMALAAFIRDTYAFDRDDLLAAIRSRSQAVPKAEEQVCGAAVERCFRPAGHPGMHWYERPMSGEKGAGT